jgi:hypothetical protein
MSQVEMDGNEGDILLVAVFIVGTFLNFFNGGEIIDRVVVG